jgi:transcriptional regulator with XRE-family HTH domain
VVRVRRLAELRQRRGWTVVELAVRANLSETTVRRLELGLAGAPRPATARALAAALGVPPAAIAELGPTSPGLRALPFRRHLAGPSPRAVSPPPGAPLEH